MTLGRAVLGRAVTSGHLALRHLALRHRMPWATTQAIVAAYTC